MIGKHLREEHLEIREHLARIREVADLIGEHPSPAIHQGVTATQAFLRTQLLPHAKVEEEVIYPCVAELLGGERATESMREDHRAIERRADELDGIRKRHHEVPDSPPPLIDLRRVLYSLDAIISLHLEKEESVYLPLLDEKLSEAEGLGLIEKAERVAAEIFSD